jgi:cyclopropane-fatty-acyl-phospholipid synthase
MRLFTLEHGKAAYVADFALYGAAILVLSAVLLVAGPPMLHGQFAACVMLGLALWTGIEYVLHRYVMHALDPFLGWHAEHHRRPKSLICTPTFLSAALVFTLVFLPALAVASVMSASAWSASALTLGVLIGYFSYGVIHHATHHWSADYQWLKQRKRWHALHHRRVRRASCFGVTSAFWDRVFNT